MSLISSLNVVRTDAANPTIISAFNFDHFWTLVASGVWLADTFSAWWPFDGRLEVSISIFGGFILSTKVSNSPISWSLRALESCSAAYFFAISALRSSSSIWRPSISRSRSLSSIFWIFSSAALIIRFSFLRLLQVYQFSIKVRGPRTDQSELVRFFNILLALFRSNVFLLVLVRSLITNFSGPGPDRVSAWAFFDHEFRLRPAPFLVFCMLIEILISHNISKN